MSNFLCDMKEGEEISCQGPFGDFILRPPLRDTIFIATGTGIAPFRSMLHWLLARSGRAIRTSNSGWCSATAPKATFITTKNSCDLAADHANFHYLPTLSRGAPEWQGLRGYVQEHVPESSRDAPTCTLTSAASTR